MSELESYLKEVRERCDAATDGPWEPIDEQRDTEVFHHVVKRLRNDNGWRYIAGETELKDTLFIAHARTDVPRLLEMVESLQARVKELEEDLFKCQEHIEGNQTHGLTYCEHCKGFVLLCSHGMGIDYKELCVRAELRVKELEAECKKLRCVLENIKSRIINVDSSAVEKIKKVLEETGGSDG